MVTNERIDLKNFKLTLRTVLERFNPKTDLHILSNISQDTLDYTGPEVNKGSKMIMLGVGEKKRDLIGTFTGEFKSSLFKNPRVFIPGVLVVQGPSYKRNDGIPEALVKEISISKFALVFLVDNSDEATANEHNFLWSIFTRFEPAGDIYGNYKVVRNHLAFEGAIIFDCRLKDWYPQLLVEDENIVKRVNDKYCNIWAELEKQNNSALYI
jgi:hypothetical protein